MLTTLNNIEFSLSEMRSKYQQALGQKEMLERQKTDAETSLQQARENIELWRDVQTLFGKVSEFARQQLKARIEETTTAALQAVFERDDIAFEIEMRTVNNQPAASWSISSFYGDTEVKAEPESAHGGGYVDIVSLALRLALLELARPRPQGPILLDEPAKMVSREYLPNLAQFLKQYAQKTERQIWMITHAEPLAEVADVSYKVRQEGGISEVTLIE